MFVFNISQDLLFWKMWCCLSDICQSSGSFEFMKVNIIDTFWFLLENLCSQNTVARNIWKKNCGRPRFSEELAGWDKFFKGFPAF